MSNNMAGCACMYPECTKLGRCLAQGQITINEVRACTSLYPDSVKLKNAESILQDFSEWRKSMQGKTEQKFRMNDLFQRIENYFNRS